MKRLIAFLLAGALLICASCSSPVSENTGETQPSPTVSVPQPESAAPADPAQTPTAPTQEPSSAPETDAPNNEQEVPEDHTGETLPENTTAPDHEQNEQPEEPKEEAPVETPSVPDPEPTEESGSNMNHEEVVQPSEEPVASQNLWATVGSLGRDYRVYRYSGQDVSRYFYYYIPSTYKTGDKLPMMLALHGSTSNAITQLNDGGWVDYAEKHGFIVVAPEAVAIHANGTLSSEGKSMAEIGQTDMSYLRWNAANTDPQGKYGVNDVKYLSDLIDLFVDTGYADPARVYSSGLSHGAFMSAKLALELPQKIAGVGIVAGLLCDQYSRNRVTMMPKVVFINGTADNIVPIGGMAYDFNYDGIKEYVWALSLEESVNWFVNRYGLSASAAKSDVTGMRGDGSAITRYAYSDSNGVEQVVSYVVTGGYHTWPGGYITGRGTKGKDADATVLVWNELKDVVNPYVR